MTSFRVPLALVLVMVAMLLAAGCIAETSRGTGLENTSARATTPAQTQCTAINNTSYWITIDPIGDKFIGDKFSVIARTNIPVGEEILAEIATTSTHCTKAKCYFVDENSIVKVVEDIDCFNKTIVNVNASTYKQNEYLVRERSATRNTSTYLLFNILSTEVITIRTVSNPYNESSFKAR